MYGYPKEIFAQIAAAMALQGMLAGTYETEIGQHEMVDDACRLGSQLAERFEQRIVEAETAKRTAALKNAVDCLSATGWTRADDIASDSGKPKILFRNYFGGFCVIDIDRNFIEIGVPGLQWSGSALFDCDLVKTSLFLAGWKKRTESVLKSLSEAFTAVAGKLLLNEWRLKFDGKFTEAVYERESGSSSRGSNRLILTKIVAHLTNYHLEFYSQEGKRMGFNIAKPKELVAANAIIESGRLPKKR